MFISITWLWIVSFKFYYWQKYFWLNSRPLSRDWLIWNDWMAFSSKYFSYWAETSMLWFTPDRWNISLSTMLGSFEMIGCLLETSPYLLNRFLLIHRLAINEGESGFHAFKILGKNILVQKFGALLHCFPSNNTSLEQIMWVNLDDIHIYLWNLSLPIFVALVYHIFSSKNHLNGGFDAVILDLTANGSLGM